jgi:hypothetical protein
LGLQINQIKSKSHSSPVVVVGGEQVKQRPPGLGTERSRSHLRKQIRTAPNKIKQPWKKMAKKDVMETGPQE